MSVIPKPAVCSYVPQTSSMFEDHSRILRISTSKICLIHAPFRMHILATFRPCRKLHTNATVLQIA